MYLLINEIDSNKIDVTAVAVFVQKEIIELENWFLKFQTCFNLDVLIL